MRHGVPGVAIGTFLGKCLDGFGGAEMLMELAVMGSDAMGGTEVRERSPRGALGGGDHGRCGSREVIVIDDSE